MKAFLYGVGLQFKMDIRSKTMLITCYLVPLVFFFFMSGIFTSVDPSAVKTLIPSMSVFVITMSALIGLPPSLGEVYGSEVKKVYKANGVPLSLGVVTQFISSFIHTLIVCLIVFAVRIQSGIADKSAAVFLFPCHSALCYPCYRVYHRLIDKDTGETDDGCHDSFSAVRYAVGYHVSGNNAACFYAVYSLYLSCNNRVSGGDRF